MVSKVKFKKRKEKKPTWCIWMQHSSGGYCHDWWKWWWLEVVAVGIEWQKGCSWWQFNIDHVICWGWAQTNVDALSAVSMYEGVPVSTTEDMDGISVLLPFFDMIDAFFSLIASSSLSLIEGDVLWNHIFSDIPSYFMALHAVNLSSSHTFHPFDL